MMTPTQPAVTGEAQTGCTSTCTVLAEKFGLESILGAFLAGAIVGLVDRDSSSHPNFRTKLDAIGYGFPVPVFFVASGIRLNLTGLLHSPAALARVPVFLLALLVVRGLPAFIGLPANGTRPTLAVSVAAIALVIARAANRPPWT